MKSLEYKLFLFRPETDHVDEMHDDCIDLDLTYACADHTSALKVACDMARGIVNAYNAEWSVVEVAKIVDAEIHGQFIHDRVVRVIIAGD